MAVQEPFLSYLTVFRSRLGVLNLVLSATPKGHQPDRALRRRVRQVLEARVEIDTHGPGSSAIFQYLTDKNIVGKSFRSTGRYRGVALTQTPEGWWHVNSAQAGALTRMPVYQTDLWFAHPTMRSTVGVPTPDNVEEFVDFAFQLHVLDRTKNSWTQTGSLIDGLRRLGSSYLADSSNPFLLGAESAALFRTLLEKDGPFILELMRFLAGRETVRREEVAASLPMIASKALDSVAKARISPQALSAGRRLVAKISETNASGGASSPGVREHRSSPRLEWLTDLGYLSKESLPKNGFEYRVNSDLRWVLEILDVARAQDSDWCFSGALFAWRMRSWEQVRLAIGESDERGALGRAYALLRPQIGPAPLRDVAFIAGMLCPQLAANVVIDRVIQLAREVPGASLSGGRLTRSPENIYMNDESLAALGGKELRGG